MTDAEIVALIDQRIGQLVRVRINELPDYSVSGNLPTLDDRIPVWRASDNKTVNTSLEVLKALLVNGTEQVLDPKLMGSIFVVTAGPSENNSSIFNIPILANKEFVLRPAGFRALKIDEEYEILISGGFKLLTRTMLEGEEFEIELINDSIPVNPGQSTGTTLYTGAVSIPTSQTINSANHLNKLIQLRPTATGMVTTLPSVDDVPENTIWCFEAALSLYESKVSTTGGQYIYFNGTSTLEIYLRPGEYLYVYRGTDGWYVWGYDSRILQVGKQVMWAYSVEDDEIELNGGTYSKALYPRFWKKIQEKFSASLVTETQWQITTQTIAGEVFAYPYRGCFADIDANTFRVPDLVESGVRAIGASSRFAASSRSMAYPGGFQNDKVGPHTHPIEFVWNGTDGQPNGQQIRQSANDNSEGGGYGSNLYAVRPNASTETIMKNIGLKAKMKI